MNKKSKAPLRSFETSPPVTLSLLWASLMGLYIYNDYFLMYMPGEIEAMSSGVMGPLGPATQPVMVAVSLLMMIPALMIVLSVALKPTLSRWANIMFGSVYTVVQALTLIDSFPFYRMVVVFECAVTLWIVAIAWRWPRDDR